MPTEELEGREGVLQEILRNHHTIPGKLRSCFGVLSLINEKKITSGPEDKNRKISRQPHGRKGGFREYGRVRKLKSTHRLWPACKRKRNKYVRCNTQKDRPSQMAGKFFSD